MTMIGSVVRYVMCECLGRWGDMCPFFLLLALLWYVAADIDCFMFIVWSRFFV